MVDYNLQIAASGDDGWGATNGSSFNNSGDNVYFGNLAGGSYRAFFRFASVVIPKDATVSSAVLRFEAYSTNSNDTVRTRIRIEDDDDPSAPSSGANLIGRSLGSSVTWDFTTNWTANSTYDTIDFSTILETHLARAGWDSGQALTVHIINDASTNNANRSPKTYDLSTTLCAELRVTYVSNSVEVTDNFTISDSVDGELLQGESQDDFTISDLIVASGGSTYATGEDVFSISDLIEVQGPVPVTGEDIFTVDDQVVAGFEYEKSGSDDFSIDDSVVVGFEYQGPVSDDMAAGDSADAFLWSEYLRENAGKYLIRFYLTLTGEADGESDLDLQFTSFQSTKRNGDATYLSVIVPGLDYSSDVTARSNGDLRVEMAYIVNGVEDFREMIIEVDLEGIRIDEGPRRGSITLSGSRVVEYGSNLVTLENPIYKYVSDGKIRYRFLYPDPWVNPGDVVQCRNDEFVVQYITYTISDRFKQMEVSET